MPGIRRLLGEISSKLVKEATPKDSWLIKKLDDSLAAIPNRQSSGGVFYPSSLGSKCDRFLYYHYRGLIPQEPISAKLRRIFDHGNVTQDRYQKYFEKLRVLISCELQLKYSNPPISGRADFILQYADEEGKKDPITGIIRYTFENYILEFKTINDTGFKKLTKATPDHEAQLQCYLNIANLTKGGVLYENKDNQDLKLFSTERNVEWWNTILDRCRKVMNLQIPPEIVEPHDKYCKCLLVKG
ncbi:hypothetical protein HYS94_01765 [Candidatus Daviesbacteria bacterium]|nr:hypothetical protein [Candidatus Daviesbacteria bacterium]